MSLYNLIKQENNGFVWKNRNGENKTIIDNLVNKIKEAESLPRELKDKEELYSLIKKQLLIYLNMKIQ
jgi:hypothetical protein